MLCIIASYLIKQEPCFFRRDDSSRGEEASEAVCTKNNNSRTSRVHASPLQTLAGCLATPHGSFCLTGTPGCCCCCCNIFLTRIEVTHNRLVFTGRNKSQEGLTAAWGLSQELIGPKPLSISAMKSYMETWSCGTGVLWQAACMQ